MTDYNAYRSTAGITTKQMIQTVAEEFPRFSKIQCSMCSNPSYGVCLLPEAEALLVEKYGDAPGLSIHKTENARTIAGKAGRPDNRKKRNRMVVRLDDDTARRIRALMAELHFTHAQDFLEQALMSMLENWEGNK